MAGFVLGALASAAKDLGKSAWQGVKKNLASGQGGGQDGGSESRPSTSYNPAAIAAPLPPTNAQPSFTPNAQPQFGPITQTEGDLMRPIAPPAASPIGGPISADQIPTRRKSLLFPQ